jgi:hypothetical protein
MCNEVYALEGGSFFEKTKVHKNPFYNVKCFRNSAYHGFSGNKIHVSEKIKSILIEAHPHILNIYTSRKKNWNLRKKQLC